MLENFKFQLEGGIDKKIILRTSPCGCQKLDLLDKEELITRNKYYITIKIFH